MVKGYVPPPDMVLHPNKPPVHVRALDAPAHEDKPAPLKFAVKRFEELAIVENISVEVAFVVVELPVINRFPEIVEDALLTSKPPVKVRREVVAEPPYEG